MEQSLSTLLASLEIVPLGEPQPLSGGDIAEVARLETRQGALVVKRDEAASLAAEAEGLRALRRANSGLIVPEVVAQQDEWLIMEALPQGGRRDPARLGEGLRTLHGVTGEHHGWPHDNHCGPTAQRNTPCRDGRVFQRDHRLVPLGEACAERGLLSSATRGALLDVAQRLESWLPDRPACLVHGDLWSGNVLTTPRGPAIIDPAVYYHYPEVDLAMLTLFGAPGEAFFEAYWDGDKPADWTRRETLFQLYPLLNHLLLFGGAYRAAVERAIARLAAD
ncbi:fructosamine kinase family protein [Chromohalobacter israelensis]|uniref:fructosamine kinase family protein n=1 Tax=Chromohalobacter israelensis TaxID=141390 RepID=UPI000556BD00|nr:fructosamine kinase family protein [Chromohalobacter israelensis]MDF9433251.1 fructosamine kinase family protein [Chromohalobacter israelensis]